MKKTIIVFISALMLAGCATTTTQYSRNDPQRGLVKQSTSTASKGAHASAPVMLRIIKESKTLELWKQNKDTTWSKIQTYEICAFSGTAGPKKKAGDRQAPEGFYNITAGQLNPMSSEYLSVNTGFPNTRDRAHGYTGSALMIHGGCSSAGCYAITDKSMEEVYAAVRDAIRSGQKSVQVQIYPFEMNTFRMITIKNNPNYEFWKELKEGWDWFEKNQRPIPVEIKNKRYYINN
jgi:murein L,D-transpeptidase YafK